MPANVLVPWWESHPMPNYKRVETVARYSRASFVVVARKARDEGLIGGDEFFRLYRQHEKDVPTARKPGKGGGDYYLNKRYKLGHVFSDAVFAAVHEGYLSYRDAYDLTGLSVPSFRECFDEVA